VRTHTIGEVLNRLKDEFDDVTISKIRFLEAEGLINPDRTDSGYRKFTDGDIERLRYILRAQRDRYLPLKVIREELDRIDAGLDVDTTPPAPRPAEVDGVRRSEDAGGGEADTLLDATAPDVDLTFTDLAEASGLETHAIHALRDHGLLRGDGPYDGDDLTAIRIAAALMDAGLEPRHLRMYRQFADREVALYEQLVAPLIRQRNPDSRRAASEQAEVLVREGARLHRILLMRELRSLLHP
jgi:DNA-binding transcriptional MerR regulator